MDSTTRWRDDAEAQRFVEEHPDGAELEEVGDAFGLSKERVRQIELSAALRMEKRLALVGITAADVREWLGKKGSRWPAP